MKTLLKFLVFIILIIFIGFIIMIAFSNSPVEYNYRTDAHQSTSTMNTATRDTKQITKEFKSDCKQIDNSFRSDIKTISQM